MPPCAGPLDRKGAFPRGDKIEVSFSSGTQGYFQFAFDCDGSKYEAKGLDSSWTCDWDVRIDKDPSGWKAYVRVPFDAIGFAPHVNPRIHFLPLVAYAGANADGASKLFSWQGGVPHTPVSWGELVVAIEP